MDEQMDERLVSDTLAKARDTASDLGAKTEQTVQDKIDQTKPVLRNLQETAGAAMDKPTDLARKASAPVVQAVDAIQGAAHDVGNQASRAASAVYEQGARRRISRSIYDRTAADGSAYSSCDRVWDCLPDPPVLNFSCCSLAICVDRERVRYRGSDQRGRATAFAKRQRQRSSASFRTFGRTGPSERRVGCRIFVCCSRRRCPDRPGCPVELSVGTGGALASPMACGQGNCCCPDGADSLSRLTRVRCDRRAGNILAGTAATGIPFKPRSQNSLAARGRTGWRSLAPCNNNGSGARQGTEAIRKPEF